MRTILYKGSLRLCFLLMFLCTICFAFAQTSDATKTLLQGKWILDSTEIREMDGQKIETFQFKDFKEVEIYPEIEIKDDKLFFDYEGEIMISDYNLNGDKLIYLNFMDISFYADFEMLNDKFCIEWGQDIGEESSDKTMIISLTYKRK